MTDYISSSFPLNTRTEFKHTTTYTRERLYSTPNLLFARPVEDTPKTRINGLIKIHNSYLDSEFVINKKETQNLNDLVSSFFNTDQTEITPYTTEEWNSILGGEQREQQNRPKLYWSLKENLPEEHRKDIWLYLAETERLKSEHCINGITYEELKSQSCCQEEKIKKDITRSFEDHEFFLDKKAEKLASVERILKAYANFDPEVGYTQGMNFLVGMLFGLIQHEYSKKQNQRQEPNFDKIESEAFWILVYIMREKNWRLIYVDKTPKLHHLLQELELKVKESHPDLHQVLMENACVSACFTRYFLTMMLHGTPHALAQRILEAFLLVGEEILFHVLVKLLAACENKILTQKDLGGLYCFLGDEMMKFASQ